MNKMTPITINPGATTAADRVMVVKRLAHHPAAGGDEHEQEGSRKAPETAGAILVRVAGNPPSDP